MTKREALNGKPYAGNPHVRFDEGEAASAVTPRRGPLLHKTSFLLLVCIAVSSFVRGDVWRDCTAWYMGGTDKDNDGVFEDGELTDIRHAAIADSPTHGGGIRINDERNYGASNRIETVVSATSGRTFPNQRVIYLAQIPGTTSNGKPGVREQDVELPFAATTNEYTVLLRFRMDESQPAMKEYVSVLDCGYKGGNLRKSFYVRYYPKDEKFGFLWNNGSNLKVFDSPTNDVCRSLRETWVEMAVSMNKGTMRMGVKAPGMEEFVWGSDSDSHSFTEGNDIPHNNKIYFGCCQGYGGVSSETFPVRGSVQLMAYWERVLSDNEVVEAFGMGNLEDSSLYSPSILAVGEGRSGSDVFTGATTNDVTEINPDLQDVALFPSGIEAGRTISIPFKVLDTCTNLPQLVRLAAAADSATGSITIKIDGTALRPVSLLPGGEVSRRAVSELFTEGLHTLTITRTDGGSGLVKLSKVEISGSWRVGWVNNSNPEMGGDVTTAKGTKTYDVIELSSNRWLTVRSSISRTRYLAMYADVDAHDAATRTFKFKTRPYSYRNESFDLVLKVNGEERFRRLCLKDDKVIRPSNIEVELPPGTLMGGRNEFLWKTELNADYTAEQTWMMLDYFALEVGKDPVGLNIIIR